MFIPFLFNQYNLGLSLVPMCLWTKILLRDSRPLMFWRGDGPYDVFCVLLFVALTMSMDWGHMAFSGLLFQKQPAAMFPINIHHYVSALFLRAVLADIPKEWSTSLLHMCHRNQEWSENANDTLEPLLLLYIIIAPDFIIISKYVSFFKYNPFHPKKMMENINKAKFMQTVAWIFVTKRCNGFAVEKVGLKISSVQEKPVVFYV